MHLPSLSTPIRANRLQHYLNDYDPVLQKYLIDGFTKGFTIHAETFNMPSPTANNSKMALLHPEAVDDNLYKELEARHIAGPYNNYAYTEPTNLSHFTKTKTRRLEATS